MDFSRHCAWPRVDVNRALSLELSLPHMLLRSSPLAYPSRSSIVALALAGALAMAPALAARTAATPVPYRVLAQQVLSSAELPRLSDPGEQAVLAQLLDPRRLQPSHMAPGETLAQVCKTAADLQNKYTHASVTVTRAPRPFRSMPPDYRPEFASFSAFTTRCTAAVLHGFADLTDTPSANGDALGNGERVPNERVRQARAARAAAMLQLRLSIGALGMKNLDGEHLATILGAAADNAVVLTSSLPIAERARLGASIQQRIQRVPSKATPDAQRLLTALRSWGCTGVCAM